MNNKLNTEQIVEIRERYALRNVTYVMLAKEYGISKSSVDIILNVKGCLENKKYGKGIPITKDNIEERFWEKVDKTDIYGCWLWNGCIKETGHGRFVTLEKLDYAHRFSWELHYGKIPKGKWVLHKCDNGKCVNPDHLFLGTNIDNIIDMNKKHRGRNKLNVEQVREIRRKYVRRKVTYVMLGEEYGVSKQVIGDLIRKTTYKFYE